MNKREILILVALATLGVAVWKVVTLTTGEREAWTVYSISQLGCQQCSLSQRLRDMQHPIVRGFSALRLCVFNQLLFWRTVNLGLSR